MKTISTTDDIVTPAIQTQSTALCSHALIQIQMVCYC